MRLIVPVLNIFSIFLIMLPTTTQAQFTGGIGQGNINAGSTSTNLGFNFYKGGSEDGVVVSSTNSATLGISFMKGGSDDGSVSAAANNQNLGSNFFKGGADDGFVLANAANQPIGINFFKGGIDDGAVSAAMTNLNLGANFFKGGADDGFAMGFVTNTPLPVTLISFTAEWQNKDVITKWTTTSESNTAYFEIERSIDGNHFIPVGKTNASGNVTTTKNYAFADVAVKTQLNTLPPRIFYRLKTVDQDGKIQYSAIVVLDLKQNQILYTLYPNPARSQFTIENAGLPNQYSFKMLSTTGQTIMQKTVKSQKETINISNIANGVYYVLITDKSTNNTQTFKIIIQH